MRTTTSQSSCGKTLTPLEVAVLPVIGTADRIPLFAPWPAGVNRVVMALVKSGVPSRPAAITALIRSCQIEASGNPAR